MLMVSLPSAGAFLAPTRAFAARLVAATRYAGRDEAGPFAWNSVETDFCLVPQGKELHPFTRCFQCLRIKTQRSVTLHFPARFAADSSVSGDSVTKALNQLSNRVAREVTAQRYRRAPCQLELLSSQLS